jgi:sulfur-oxidizing protein SoxY
MKRERNTGLSRRGFFRAAGASAITASAVAAAGVSLIPATASADAAKTMAAIDKLTGGAATKSGRIKMKTPIIAENGAVVPIIISVDSPMTDSDYVKSLSVFVQNNPSPEVATFNFTPACGAAEVKVNCRMAKTSAVVAVAIMSDGSVYKAEKTVKVTIGGCGG